MTRANPIAKAISSAALQILADQPEAPIQVRLLRDVLRVPPNHPDLISTTAALDRHPQLQTLAREQRPDGSWGRFHSSDSTSDQKNGTTEIAIQRALELGLAPNHPILTRARPYLEAILTGRIPFPDRAETHENWPTGVTLFSAAMLARFAPESPTLDEPFAFWSAVLGRSFRTGRHDRAAELQTHQDLLGRSGTPGWMSLRSKYVVMVLAARPHRLPAPIEAAYLRWLWRDCPAGLVYFEIPFEATLRDLRGFRLGGWLTCLDLLAPFPSARRLARPAIDQLLAARRPDGLWDFGPQPACPRLSSTYRQKRFSAHDWTTRITCLLQRFAMPRP